MVDPKLALIPSGYAWQKVFSVLPASGDGDFDFSRNSKATRINKDGFIEEVANHIPRLDYTDSSCPSLLLEPQSSNLITYSEDFSHSSWNAGTNCQVDSDFSISPDGTQNADKLTAISNTASRRDVTVSVSALTYKKASIWIKKGNVHSSSLIKLIVQGDAAYGFTDDLTITDNWVRYEILVPNTDTSTSLILRVYPTRQIGGTLGDEILVWGAQLEELSHATSYIPTNGATATRLADECNSAGTSDTFNDSEGVLFAEISALADEGGVRAISLNDGSVQNRISIRYNSTSNQIQYQYTVGSSVQANILANVVDVKTPHKIAVKYKLNDFELFIDGISRGTDLVGSIMPSGTLTKLDINGSGSLDYFYGKTKQVQYYNSALTDSELEQLTSWTSFSDMAQGQLYTIE